MVSCTSCKALSLLVRSAFLSSCRRQCACVCARIDGGIGKGREQTLVIERRKEAFLERSRWPDCSLRNHMRETIGRGYGNFCIPLDPYHSWEGTAKRANHMPGQPYHAVNIKLIA